MSAEARERIEALVPRGGRQQLQHLLNQARCAEGAERARWATSLNALLETPPAERDTWGAALVNQLDDLDGLVGVDGVPCRRRAVEAVLELGWPWALHVTPEDLDSLKVKRPWLSALVPVGGLLGVIYALFAG